jgi:hypothetical protein
MHSVKNVVITLKMVNAAADMPAAAFESLLASIKKFLSSGLTGVGSKGTGTPGIIGGRGGADSVTPSMIATTVRAKINVKLENTTAGLSKLVGTEVVDIVSVL